MGFARSESWLRRSHFREVGREVEKRCCRGGKIWGDLKTGGIIVSEGHWPERQIIRGKYRILSKLGQGGMGTVYKAEHLHLKDVCALKVMSPELAGDHDCAKRFEREAILARKLRHPNAVRVEDFDHAEDGRPFIAMEFVDGDNLKRVIQAEEKLSIERACSIAKEVASALAAAHELGIVHRDIKPDNIMLVLGLDWENRPRCWTSGSPA